jgi:hypothetical protein
MMRITIIKLIEEGEVKERLGFHNLLKEDIDNCKH